MAQNVFFSFKRTIYNSNPYKAKKADKIMFFVEKLYAPEVSESDVSVSDGGNVFTSLITGAHVTEGSLDIDGAEGVIVGDIEGTPIGQVMLLTVTSHTASSQLGAVREVLVYSLKVSMAMSSLSFGTEQSGAKQKGNRVYSSVR